MISDTMIITIFVLFGIALVIGAIAAVLMVITGISLFIDFNRERKEAIEKAKREEEEYQKLVDSLEYL